MTGPRLQVKEKESLAYAIGRLYFDKYKLHQLNGSRVSNANQKRKEHWQELENRIRKMFPRYNLYKDLYQWYQRFISQTKGKYLEAKKSGNGVVTFSKAEELILDRIGRGKIEGLRVPELGIQGLSISSLQSERNCDTEFSSPIRRFSPLPTVSDEYDQHCDLDSRIVDDFNPEGIDALESRRADDNFDFGKVDTLNSKRADDSDREMVDDLDSRTVDSFNSEKVDDLDSRRADDNFDFGRVDNLESRRADDIGDFSQLELEEEWAFPRKKSRSGQKKEIILDTIEEMVRKMDSYCERLVSLLEKNSGINDTDMDNRIKEIRIRTEETKLKIEEAKLRTEEARAEAEQLEIQIKKATLEKLHL